MARIAVRAVVHVVPYPTVFFVHSQLVVLVTTCAGKRGKVRRILVAICTSVPFPGVGTRVDREPCVIERGAAPTRSVVARRARRRESRGNMVRISHAGVIGLMAGVTIRRRTCVLAADVTTRALDIDVSAGEWECRQIVVEVCWNPRRGAVADFTCLRKASRDVIWILGVVVVAQVARGAGRAQPRVLPVHVTTCTDLVQVRAGKWKLRLGMIEFCSGPGRSRMTHRAICRKTRGDVIRVRRLVEVIYVARSAIGWRAIETTVDVALRALQRRVCSGQDKAREGPMIKLRASPGHRRVALLAGAWES